MPKKNTWIFIFAIGDLAVGVLSLVFFAVGSFVLPQIAPLEPLSTPFLISLAVPTLILIAGIANLRRSSYSPVLTFFVSFLVGINSLTEMLAGKPPYFLAGGVSPALTLFFHYVVPSAAIAYFAAHSLASFIAMKRNKADEEPNAGPPLAPRREKFCATCRAALKETDDVCPSCGALLSGWRCPACGYEGRKEDFHGERCPRCGKELPSDSET